MSNLISLVSESTCKYLFGREGNEIFGNLKFSKNYNSSEQRKIVDECLELIMRINVFILTKKDALFLIDPMASNNQCHLYSLRAAQIMKDYRYTSGKEKLAKTEENRFLHLSFFISYSLMKDTTLFVQAVQRAIAEMGEKIPSPKRIFNDFLRDDGKYRERSSRIALNRLFEGYVKDKLSLYKENNALYKDLYNIAHEKLQIESCEGRDVLYTYPKLAGVAYMVDILAKEQIPFVIKVKVITKNGAAGTIIQASDKAEEKAPVIVFEAIATDGSLTLLKCTEEAKKCPTYFYQYTDKNQRHSEEKTCFFCKKATDDLEPYRQRLQTAMRTPEDMFYALGADFILRCQKDFQVFFKDDKKYPYLAKLFAYAIPKISELGLAMDKPITFSMCHVHMDSASHALSEKLLLDTSPEGILKDRGII